MAESSTQITSKLALDQAVTRAKTPGIPAAGRKKPGVPYRVLKALASLRITVALFSLSLVLIFCGTLAQIDNGIWTVVAKYFRSFYVWIPLQIFFPRDRHIGGGFPYPGGWLLGSVLLVNLLAAHAIRFKLSLKRTGIVLLHAGLIVLMVSELVTGIYAAEGSMAIITGGTSDYLMSPHEVELAIMTVDGTDRSEVSVVPMALLRQSPHLIQSEQLPFDLEVVEYMANSNLYKLDVPDEKLLPEFVKLRRAPENLANPGTAGAVAKSLLVVPAAEVGGVEGNREDHPALYVRIKEKPTGRDLGTYLLLHILQDEPQYISAGGKRYDLRLRYKRTYKPYTVKLLEFHHDVYVGTNTPKNFSSKIRITDPEQKVDREVLISMNNPLRFGGETFYQQSVLGNDQGTVLQVVRNPGWLMPYISCVMVALGMLLHFGMNLTSFLQRRAVS